MEKDKLLSVKPSSSNLSEDLDNVVKKTSYITLGITILFTIALIVLYFLNDKTRTAIMNLVFLGVCFVPLYLYIKNKVRLGNIILISSFFLLLIFIQISGIGYAVGDNFIHTIYVQSIEFIALIVVSVFIIHRYYSLILGIVAMIDIIIISILFGGNEIVLTRLPIIIPVMTVIILIVYNFKNFFRKLLDKALKEANQNKQNYTEIESIFNKIKSLKVNYDTSHDSISENMNEIDNIITIYSDKSELLTEKAKTISEILKTTEESLYVVTNSIKTVSEKISTQASFVSEISASQEEIFRSIESINQNTIQVNKINEELVNDARSNEEILTQSMESFSNLEQYQSRMIDIVGVISSISNQTNLLAMNANIEAAHAGQHGAGFGVVADEIRKLADESGLRTKEISDVIKAMSTTIETSISNINTVKTNLLEITRKINVAYPLIQEISSSISEQNTTNREFLKLIKELVETTSIIRDNTNEGREATDSYNEKFRELKLDINEILSVIQELSTHNEKSRELINNISEIEKENEIINQNMNELIASQDE
jgi:methyl-accepting chemotaxis protein